MGTFIQLSGEWRRQIGVICALLAAFLLVTACEETQQQADAEKPAEETAGETSGAAKAAEAMVAHVEKPWTGDYSGMEERRLVRVLLPYSKTFFFLDDGKERGINYEFLTRFEKHLNAKRKKTKDGKPSHVRVVMIPTQRDKLLSDLKDGRGDLALGNLTITPEREELVAFSDPWLTNVEELVVTPASAPEITSVEELSGRPVHVRKSSSYYESLQHLNERLKEQGKTPVEIVLASPNLEDEALIEMVNADGLLAIIVDSHKARFWAKVFDNIRVNEKAAVRKNGKIAWAFRKNSPELTAQVNAFIKTVDAKSRVGSAIFAAYLRSQKWLKKVNNKADTAKFDSLLDLFQKYGKEYDINWLILAAKAYQESGFDNSAKGPTGAVGIMQIKPATAASPEVDIPDVTKLDNNVHAATKYTRFLMDRYYADLKHDPLNQTLMAFAGYNAGPNRIANLRKKARERGLNPDKWFNNVEWVV
ncbi:MAG: lytic transglycosylase F, partial [Pseudomonadota bacterium]